MGRGAARRGALIIITVARHLLSIDGQYDSARYELGNLR